MAFSNYGKAREDMPGSAAAKIEEIFLSFAQCWLTQHTMNNCHTIYAPPILAICEQPILIMSIWFGVLTLKRWSPEWYEWGCYRQKTNKQAQIKSLATIVVVRDILFWFEHGMYLYFRLLSVQISIRPIFVYFWFGFELRFRSDLFGLWKTRRGWGTDFEAERLRHQELAARNSWPSLRYFEEKKG